MLKGMKDRLAIGKQGEYLVMKLLPGSNWMNGEKESGEKYDIYWNEIKIDVKTSTRQVSSTSYSFIMASYWNNEDYNITNKNIIYVFVALREDETRFWVSRFIKDKKTYYLKLKDSISGDKLADEILKLKL